LMENIPFQARKSEFVDQKSGVSARLGISVLEAVVAGAERRLLLSGDDKTVLRINDIYDAIQAINGKIEMVYEGEQEGPYNVAMSLINQSIRETFLQYFPAQNKKGKNSKASANDIFNDIEAWFNLGNTLLLKTDINEIEFKAVLDAVPELKKVAKKLGIAANENQLYTWMEFILHGLAAVSRISKSDGENAFEFKDLLGGIMNMGNSDEAEDFGGGYYEE
jgi:magnesium chelatase subunit I